MIMNQYELIYVTRPTLNAEDLAKLSTKVSGLIEKGKGQVLATEEWGRRRLAYPILKNEHGLYTYINFVAPADVPLGVEKSMGLDDSFMRYMTVRLGENVDVASVRQVAETKKAERDAARAAEEEAARVAAEEEAARAAEAAESLPVESFTGANAVCLAISCVGRRLVLGPRVEEELEAVRDALPEDCGLLGYYSYGEISPLHSGRCDLHNQTMTLSVFWEQD